MSTMLLPYTNSETVKPLPEPAPASIFDRNKYLQLLRSSFVWVMLTIAVLASFVFGYTQAALNGIIFTALAFVPLAVLVAITFFTIRRYELSLWDRLLAVVWGGTGATGLTFFIITLQNQFIGASESTDSIVVQAAIVEEFAKGLFLLGLFFFAKLQIRTPLTGLMLGVLVGAGFAFVENILYFTSAFNAGGWAGFWNTYFLRAGQSFFLHSLATMFTGLFIGYVVNRNFKWFKSSVLIFTGFLSAMTVHGMWNGMSSLTTENMKWLMLYFLFWMPFLALMVTVVVLLWRKHNRARLTRLQEAVEAGFIREKQAERLSDKKARKLVYKNNRTRDVIQWERSLDEAFYWNVRAYSLNPERRSTQRKRARYQKRQTQALMRLASVVETV